jgi:predicted dehydrogenase
MGMVHAAILNALEGATLVAACEPNATIRSGFESFVPDVRFYKDHHVLLDSEDLEAVFITTPTEFHVDTAIDCIERGCAVFVEKPLALDVASSDRVLLALKKRPVCSMVGFMMRYVDTFARAKKLIDSAVIGRPLAIEGSVYTSQVFQKGRGWRSSKKKSGGGVVMMQGIHALDLIGWYFGLPQDLSARVSGHYSQEVEDFAHITFGWEDGLIGWLDCSWSVDNRRLMEVRIQVTGELGTLVVDDDTIRVYMRGPGATLPAGWTVETKPELSTGVPIDIGGPQYTREDLDFVGAVRRGSAVASDLLNARNVQALVEGAYASADDGGRPVGFDW